MNQLFTEIIINSTQSRELGKPELIQELWSGYGQIFRYPLLGSTLKSVVVKNVRLPDQGYHPRGWNTNLSHERKIKSYQIEMAFYKQWAEQCDDDCRIPHCLAMETQGDEVLMVLEDLNSSGFPARRTSVSWNELKACLKWLANFHATFINQTPENLWETGTYWHLETRPDEFNELTDKALRKAAEPIDKILQQAKYQTFVHGDAKLANFCFSTDGKDVAAVDFQYVGGGCGMKDVIYFIGSCLYEEDCERLEDELLEFYFKELKTALISKNRDIDPDAVEKEWRELFPVAWTDFHRFLKGWSPGHWKINSYSERMAREVISKLNL